MEMKISRPKLWRAVRLTLAGSLCLLPALGGIRHRSLPSFTARQVPPEVRERILSAYGQLPIAFQANRGQADPSVRFLSQGKGYGLFLTASETVLALRKGGARPASERAAAPCRTAEAPDSQSVLVRMKLAGSNPRASVEGEEPLSGTVNYFIGNDPRKWHTDIPTFGKVRYRDVYPGIDLVYYGRNRQLEYDLALAAGADPRLIRLSFEGLDKLEVDGAGDLILHTGGDRIVQHKPVVYQKAGATRKERNARYVLLGNREVGFRIGAYDRKEPLFIDPVLTYSTFLGSSGNDVGNGIAVDSSGNAYVVGWTDSSFFPTQNPFELKSNSDDAFVTKINAAGSALVFSTFLGGNGSDIASAVALDSSNNVYVTGRTDSLTFPVMGAIQSSLRLATGGYDCHTNAFVTKLNAAGNTLAYSTYLGGRGDGGDGDVGNGIGVDSSNNAYVAGSTSSADFPTASAFQPALAGNFLWMTANGGTSWSAVETGLPKRTVISIAVDPKTPSIVYVSLVDGGVWKSTNSGGTWAQVSSGIPNGGDITSLVVDPINDTNVYAAGGNNGRVCFYQPGVFKSTNSGGLWTAMNTGLTNKAVRGLGIDPQNPTTLYAATDGRFFFNSNPADSTVVIFKSTDGSATWNVSDTGIPKPNAVDFVVVDPSNSNNVYAGTGFHIFGVSSNVKGIFKSTNGGANWSQLTGFIAGFLGASALAIDPSNPTTLYASGNFTNMSKSTDGGTTWTAANTGLNHSVSSILIDPVTTSTIYAGTSGGVYKSTNGGGNWSLLTIPGTNLPSVTTLGSPRAASTVYAALPRQSDGFISKINPAGSALTYSTFFGGGDGDEIRGIAVDATGNAYLTGSTQSVNFPTFLPKQASSGGNGLFGCFPRCNDAFVTKINSAGSALAYSTYLGGSGDDTGKAVAFDSLGDAYVTGSTNSTNFPTMNAFQGTLNGSGFATNAFVTEMSPTGSAFVFSTYLGGKVNDSGNGIAVDGVGNVTVAGQTSSPDFPLVKPLQCYGGNGNAFLARFTSTGTVLNYSTYLGGSSGDSGNAVALDSSGNAYVTGDTRSSDFPTVNPLQSVFGGGNCGSISSPLPCSDAFVSKISLQGTSGSDLVMVKCESPNPVAVNGLINYTLYVTNAGPTATTNVATSDTLPAQVSFVSSNSSQGSCSGTSTVNCNLGSLANDTGATVAIVAMAKTPGAISNTATVSSAVTDPNPPNNSSSASTLILTPTNTPTPSNTPTPTTTPTITPTITPTSTPTFAAPQGGVVVPTLSPEMLAALVLGLAAVGFLLTRKGSY